MRRQEHLDGGHLDGRSETSEAWTPAETSTGALVVELSLLADATRANRDDDGIRGSTATGDLGLSGLLRRKRALIAELRCRGLPLG